MVDQKSGPQSGGESADRGLSLREFARRLGISERAVRKARDAGRLVNCLGNDGKIIDFERAKLAFANSSRTGVGVRTDGPHGPQSAAATPVAPTLAPPTVPPARSDDVAWREDGEGPDDDTGGQLVFATRLIDAQTAATNERARKLKFENDETAGRLIPIEKVTKEAFEAERIIRENILNLVSRVGGELHAERDLSRFLIKFDTCLRQALNTVAEGLLAVAVNE